MPSISDIDVHGIVSPVIPGAGPGPLAAGRPVLHHLPGVSRCWSLQPEPVEYGILIGVGSFCRPGQSRSSTLGVFLVRCQCRHLGRLVGREAESPSQSAIVCRIRIVLSVSGIYIDAVCPTVIAGAGPDPLVLDRPVLYHLPGVSCSRSLQPELVVDGFSVRI